MYVQYQSAILLIDNFPYRILFIQVFQSNNSIAISYWRDLTEIQYGNWLKAIIRDTKSKEFFILFSTCEEVNIKNTLHKFTDIEMQRFFELDTEFNVLVWGHIMIIPKLWSLKSEVRKINFEHFVSRFLPCGFQSVFFEKIKANPIYSCFWS